MIPRVVHSSKVFYPRCLNGVCPQGEFGGDTYDPQYIYPDSREILPNGLDWVPWKQNCSGRFSRGFRGVFFRVLVSACFSG